MNGPGTLFNTLNVPVRLLDTRVGFSGCYGGAGPHTPDKVYFDPVAVGCTGIPSSAVAVQGNATAVNNTTNSPAGYVVLYPGSSGLPLAANINYLQGQVIPNAFISGVGTLTTSGVTYTNVLKIYASSTIDVVIDLTGYFV